MAGAILSARIMKIAIAYDVAYPYRHGGGEKRNWEIARRLAALGHETWLVSMQMWDGPAGVVRDGVHCIGICPYRPKHFGKGRRSAMEPFYFAAHLFSFLKRSEFDIVDCSSFPYLPCLAAKVALFFRQKPKLIVTWYEARGLRRWIEHRGVLGPAAWLCEILAARISRFNVAISGFTRTRAKEVLGLANAEVIPCGVQVRNESVKDSAGRKQILYVGRLVNYKRVDLLIEAFSDIALRFPGYILKIVGSGYAREELGQLAKSRGLTGRVRFDEGLSDEDLQREYESSAAFVLPSEQEGFGIVLLEAMAAGTPVLVRSASNSAATALVEDGVNGLVFESHKELAEKLGDLLEDNTVWLSLSKAGSETAQSHDWDAVIMPTIVRYYSACLGSS